MHSKIYVDIAIRMLNIYNGFSVIKLKKVGRSFVHTIPFRYIVVFRASCRTV